MLTERSDIRRNPPDILITNYKMLDLLLQRGDDLPLWRDADIRYVVVDEFHTYDGAQGTDVAMLLRRLAAATGHAEPGRPLGRICPVATSATLGETAGNTERIREVAEEVFGTPFAADSVIGEQRQAPGDFLGPVDYGLPLPDPQDLAALPDPRLDPTAMEQVAAGGHRAGRPARRRNSAGAAPAHPHPRADRGARRQAVDLARDPRRPAPQGTLQLGRGVPAVAADGGRRARPVHRAAVDRARPGRDRPFLHVETHLWIRPLSRIVRLISDRPAFGWYGEAAPEAESTLGGTPRESLPAIYCRHCGRSGWAAISPERDPQDLDSGPAEDLPGRRLRQAPGTRLHRRHRARKPRRARPAQRGRPGGPGARTRRPPRPAAQPGPRHRHRRGR